MALKIYTTAPPPLLFVIGLAFLAGAAALAWFSAPTTMMVTRTGSQSATVRFEDRLFGLVVEWTDRIEHVRSVASVIPRPEGSTSRTSTRRFLVFDTPGGRVFAGPSRHWFERHADEINQFIRDPSPAELELRKTADGWELLRFLLATVAVVFLAAMSGLLMWLGVRGLFPDPDAGIGKV